MKVTNPAIRCTIDVALNELGEFLRTLAGSKSESIGADSSAAACQAPILIGLTEREVTENCNAEREDWETARKWRAAEDWDRDGLLVGNRRETRTNHPCSQPAA